MTNKDKDLLIKDLCCRLPYSVICKDDNINVIGTLSQIGLHYNMCSLDKDDGDSESCYIYNCKPYLFPLSSMTEEQKEELITITNGKFRYMCGDITNAIPRKNSGEWGISENAYIHDIKVINILYTWLLKNHFDINGLIPMGLANDATGKNIY